MTIERGYQPIKIVRILTECPNLSAEWLMRDKGSMLLSSEESQPIIDKKTTDYSEKPSPTIDKLLDKLDQREQEIGNLREEIGRLKAKIEILEAEGRRLKNNPSYAHSMKTEAVET